ncbi:MAG TPA: adenylyltransferase/cytidyltransferase family protein [Candidatus Polarisedimenticolia bacterium]|nr:adenylyltransferase/cytidyltransferase family protein [Candidatus Polarisedimenticolia bacterium]
MGQVVSQSELIQHRGEWNRHRRGVVCVTGCFDLLHPGHIRLLEQARALGDVLVVAVQSDASVRASANQKARSQQRPKRHTPPRPITPAAERAEILAALASVDYVIEFDDPSLRELLARLRPDVVVRGAAAGAEKTISSDDKALEAIGCKVVRVPLEPGYSTARLVERIAELHA